MLPNISSVCESRCAHMCTHESGRQRTTLDIVPLELSTLFLEKKTLASLELVKQAGLASSASLGDLPVSSIQVLGLEVYTTMHGLLCGLGE